MPDDKLCSQHTQLFSDVEVIKVEVNHIKETTNGMKEDQSKGFDDVTNRIDELIKTNGGNSSSNKAEKRVTMFGLEVPKKYMAWFLMGVIVAVYLLISQFPGLMQMLEILNSNVESVAKCEKIDGKMQCEGSIDELMKYIDNDDKEEIVTKAETKEGE